MIEFLIGVGTDPEARDLKGRTPIDLAVERFKSPEAVDALHQIARPSSHSGGRDAPAHATCGLRRRSYSVKPARIIDRSAAG
jgi:hypothetical protein